MTVRTPASAGAATPAEAILPEDKPLKRREQLFVEAYLDCMNGAMSARRAGYSKNSAHVTASQLIRKPNVRKRIEAGFKDRVMSREEILTRLTDLAAFDSGELLTEANGHGVKMDLKEAKARGLTRFIRKYSKNANGTETVELYSTLEAMQMLGKFHAMWVERTEHTGANGGPIELDDIRTRLLGRFAQGDAAPSARSLPEPAEPG